MKLRHFVNIFLLTILITSLFSCHLMKKPVVPPPPPPPFIPAFKVYSANDSFDSKKPGGIFYMLPQSKFEVTVSLTKTEQIKGPYASFASKYLGIDNVISNNSVSWQIRDMDIRAIPVPDPSQLFYIALGDGDSSTIPLSLQLNLNALQSLSGSGMISRVPLVENNYIGSPKSEKAQYFRYNSESNLSEVVDTTIVNVPTDTQSTEKKIVMKKLIEKPAEQKAKEAADFILKIRDQRFSLLTGYQEIPYDPSTIRFMAAELDRMEREYLELFTGVTVTTTYKRSYSYIPRKADDCIPVSLGRFSVAEGILPNESPKGEPIFIQVCTKGVMSTGDMTKYKSVASMSGDYSFGFAYRIPEWSDVTLYLGSRIQKETGMFIPQLGTVARLPYFISNFELDPETGAILRIIHP
jgi:hypothetical protein